MGVPQKKYYNSFPNLKIDALKWCIQLSESKLVLKFIVNLLKFEKRWLFNGLVDPFAKVKETRKWKPWFVILMLTKENKTKYSYFLKNRRAIYSLVAIQGQTSPGITNHK